MGAVYEGLTQEELDSAYDNQRHVPGFAAVVAEYGQRSEAARASLECRVGVSYGPGERQRLDIFPAGEGAPVHVFFHGGAWRGLHRDDASAQAPAMVAAGVAFVAAGFDLATSVTLDEMVAQARNAVAWVAAHAHEFGGDPARLTVSGHSSGAHMAAMVTVTDWAARGLPGGLVRGALLVSGIYDLHPVRLSYRNTLLRLDAERARQLSPVHQRPVPGTRVVLAAAEHETGEFHRQTRALQQAWSTPPVIVVRGRNHYTVALDMADPGTTVGAACLSLATR